ncbi:DUF1385 domain-containing protein [Brevibacillus laterosporus]|uniref:DUF1385 domain-containing protein n=1 Tax=Brevibacillus laterosporus TaxID=1465 RepID=UPI00264D61D2|nr:DUF1385 domain-containing protein [Brevibacillus laterosporus]MDN9009964.1 DUF1385 domain-containing protein [Brevibacillus laterosporus]MDO0940654.1 DUF1385 domain-containing protein [Brevibacillus laterosporus]
MKQQNVPAYGGQAVIEGVMFGGRKVTVTAIRRKNQEIEFFEEPKKTITWVNNLKKIPFLRGIVGLIEASASGAKHLNFASEQYSMESDDEADKSSGPSKMTLILGVAVVGVLSFLVGKILFTVVPAILAGFLFGKWVPAGVWQNLIEGGIKFFLLIGYISLIAQTPLIKRLFQYHGAEHKVINAYEAGVELTVKNVQSFSTLHYRCGSSFLIFSIIVGVFVYSLVDYHTMWDRVVQRIILLPVVIGVSYEVLQGTNLLRDIPILRFLGYPGLWLQRITTREPDDTQVEVAIASFEKMRERDQEFLKNQKLATTG